jgi:hypothetical protein
VWLICTIRGPKDFRASRYALGTALKLFFGLPLMATALEYWFGSLAPHVVVEREKGWSDDPDAAPLP